jgi:hypothetical protein
VLTLVDGDDCLGSKSRSIKGNRCAIPIADTALENDDTGSYHSHDDININMSSINQRVATSGDILVDSQSQVWHRYALTPIYCYPLICDMMPSQPCDACHE